MTNNDTRLARLRRECDFAAGPVWLLAVACAVLVLVLELKALLGETAPMSVLGQPQRSQLQDVTIDQLKAFYLACDREAMLGRASNSAIMQCSVVYEELKLRAFDGNFEELLAWSHPHLARRSVRSPDTR